MPIYAPKPEYKAKCKNGLYKARVTKVEHLPDEINNFTRETEDKVKFIFTLTVGKESVELMRKVKLSMHEKANCFHIVTGVIGRIPEKPYEFDVQSIEGMRCQVLVKNAETEKGTFTNIVEILAEDEVEVEKGIKTVSIEEVAEQLGAIELPDDQIPF